MDVKIYSQWKPGKALCDWLVHPHNQLRVVWGTHRMVVSRRVGHPPPLAVVSRFVWATRPIEHPHEKLRPFDFAQGGTSLREVWGTPCLGHPPGEIRRVTLLLQDLV